MLAVFDCNTRLDIMTSTLRLFGFACHEREVRIFLFHHFLKHSPSDFLMPQHNEDFVFENSQSSDDPRYSFRSLVPLLPN
jgi:hypothetical protein